MTSVVNAHVLSTFFPVKKKTIHDFAVELIEKLVEKAGEIEYKNRMLSNPMFNLATK